MAGVDDTIGNWVKTVETSGELKHGRFWGKPLDLDDGYEVTPRRVRMAYRILKNAGYVPGEVAALRELARLREEYQDTTDDARKQALSLQIAALEQKVAVMIDKLQSQR